MSGGEWEGGVCLRSDPWLVLPYSFKPFSTIMEGTEDLRVADLIDVDNGCWIEDIIDELFTTYEADLITSIPLSLGGGLDRLMWH